MEFDKQTIAGTTNPFSPMTLEKNTSEVAQKPANPTPFVSWERGRKKEILRLFFPPPSPLTRLSRKTRQLFFTSLLLSVFWQAVLSGVGGGREARSLFESRRLRRCGRTSRSGLPFLIRLSMRGRESERRVVVVCTKRHVSAPFCEM